MPDPLEYALLSADAAIYALLAFQLLASRRNRALPDGMSGAFAALAAEIKRSMPTVPPGFTWGEALGAIRKLRLDLDWSAVEEGVRQYELYRYGGREEPKTGYSEIARLARALRRGR
jgi:hypothetical protein